MNIVQLNDFEKARSGLSRQESVSLLRECREVAFRRLHAGLIRMLGKVDDTLFEWSEKSEAKAEQNLYFDAMREMRLKRASIEIDFKAQLIEGFNREIRKEADAEGQSLSADQMSLVDEDGLEESLAVKNMVSKIEVECRHELHNLNQRVGVLLNDPELARAKNPIGPDVICNAFREACGDFTSGIKVKLIVMKLFDRYVVTEEVHLLYQEVNRILIEKGVLPGLRYDVKRVPGRVDSDKADCDDDEGGSEDFYSALQKLMLKGGAAGNVASAAVINGLVSALTQLQQGNMAQLEGGFGNVDQAALMSGTVNVIRDIKVSGVAGNVGGVEGMVIDVIAMLFDYIFDDADIPPTMKALLGRLQIPMLKVGMLDKEFFSRRAHPARRLLNVLAQASVGWNADTDQPLYTKIENIVQQVLEGFDKDIALFSTLLEDFESYLTREKQKAVHLEEQSTRLVQGTERLRLAKQKVRIEVARRNKSCLPKFVRQFLVSYWQNLLLVTLVKEGEDSISWKRGLTAMDNLVWSLQPMSTTLERDRLLKLLPSLLRVLREGMVLISMREDEFQDFLEQLASCHANIVNVIPRETATSDTVSMPMLRDDPLAEMDDCGPVVEDKAVTTATIHRLVATGDLKIEEVDIGDEVGEVVTAETELKDDFVTQARDIKQGTWVEFTQEDGSAVRAKLTWVSPVTGVYLFTNRQGLKACDTTLQGLAAELRRGSARVLVDAPLFDRAVSSVIDGLRKQAVA